MGSQHETPPHFPPALPPPGPGLRGPTAEAQQAQQEQQRPPQGWQTTAVKRPQQQQQQEEQQPQQRAASQAWQVWRGCCAQSQLQGTKLPHQLAAGLLQVHPEPGGEVLQVQQHEGGQPGQQGQGGSLPGSRGQGQTEIFLDWRSGQERPDQLAVRQEIQRRQLVPHWRGGSAPARQQRG